MRFSQNRKCGGIKMGRKSIKDNKNIFQKSRENANMTREKASESIGFMSQDRIERIESEKCMPHPDEILAMSKAYGDSLLCNKFCSGICPIGKNHVPEIELTDLSHITIETLSTLNTIEKYKNKMIEIAADDVISEGEKEDFYEILKLLKELSLSARKLKIWVDSTNIEK